MLTKTNDYNLLLQEEASFMLNSTAVFSIKAQEVTLTDQCQGASLSFPRMFLDVVLHFSQANTLSSAIVMLEDQDTFALQTVFSLLKALIKHGMLVDATDTSAQRKNQLVEDIWGRWGHALAYYLASRTLAEQPYYSHEQIEARLSEKFQKTAQPSSFKDYPDKRYIVLPSPLMHTDSIKPFMEVLLGRRSTRAYSGKAVDVADLSKILYYTWGATASSKNDMGDVFLKKTSPSGGSLHSAEVYMFVMNVDGLSNGIYHYSVRHHGLELLSADNPREWITTACANQQWIAQAAAVFLTTSVMHRVAWKYEFSRALRVVMLDIGHLSQTFSLVAAWLGLGAFTTAALRDEIFETKLGLNHLEEPVFMVNGIGYVHDPNGVNDRPEVAQA
jgi:SagB-type dehydrogenase family enzyme